jgi:Peptidase family S41
MHRLILKILITLLVFNCMFCKGFSQTQFKDDIDFLSFAIKDTYAGYADKVKGSEFDSLVARIKQSNSKDTFALVSQMTLFFNDQHLVLYDENIVQHEVDKLQCKKDSQHIKEYFSNSKRKDKYEGYWLSGFNNVVIALKKVKSNPVTYYGYVAECNAKLPVGYCMMKMTLQRDGTYITDYIDADFYFRIFLKSKFKDRNTLWVNSFDKFRRIPQYNGGTLINKKAISYKPTFTRVDSKTVLLTMPSFRTMYVAVIDSLVKANKTKIDSATTLILDIRNNGGGVITNYRPLFPYIYTNPIIHVSSYARYSEAYIKNYEATMKRYIVKGDTVKAKSYIYYFDSVKAKKGQLVYREGDTLAKNLPVLAKPKNVAILINNICVSAAELMLLNFKQSKKVKLFGEQTAGGVDYLDAHTLESPVKKYTLFVAMTKRVLTASNPSYDGKGIKPDVEISDDITDWVAFVKKYYDEHQ